DSGRMQGDSMRQRDMRDDHMRSNRGVGVGIGVGVGLGVANEIIRRQQADEAEVKKGKTKPKKKETKAGKKPEKNGKTGKNPEKEKDGKTAKTPEKQPPSKKPEKEPPGKVNEPPVEKVVYTPPEFPKIDKADNCDPCVQLWDQIVWLERAIAEDTKKLAED